MPKQDNESHSAKQNGQWVKTDSPDDFPYEGDAARQDAPGDSATLVKRDSPDDFPYEGKR